MISILRQRMLINIDITSHSQLRIRLPLPTCSVISPGSDLVRPLISSLIHCSNTSEIYLVISYRPVPPCNIIIINDTVLIIITIKTYRPNNIFSPVPDVWTRQVCCYEFLLSVCRLPSCWTVPPLLVLSWRLSGTPVLQTLLSSVYSVI